MAAVALAVAETSFLACNDDTTPKLKAGACCVTETLQHEISPLDCKDDFDCVAGTVCLEATPASRELKERWTKSCAGHVVGEKVCQIPETRSGDRQALTHGFQVRAFHLEQVRGEDGALTPSFTWASRDRAHVVHCALFQCRPVIRAVSTVEGVTIREIINFDTCVLAHEVFEPGSGVFDLTNPEIEHAPEDTPFGTCLSSTLIPQENTSPQRIAELSVGCWAYDTTSIVAATPIESVSPHGMFDYREAFDLACSGTESRKACLAPSGYLGACEGGACREVCLTAADCAPPSVLDGLSEATQDGGGGGEAGNARAAGPSVECRYDEHDILGVCMPADGGTP